MKPTPLISALMLMSAWPVTASAQQAATTDEDTREIVVTGRSLKETGDALAACLARKCPPDEDVAASLAHAENQMLSGKYKDSRATLLASIGRNRKHGKAYPVPVSDLLRANGRVAEHVGEAKNFQLSVLDMRDTLKDGLGAKDPRTLVAQIEVGDSRAKLGYGLEALRIYEDVEKEAMALNLNRVAMFARVRQALLLATFAEDSEESYDMKRATDKLQDIIANPLKGAEEYVLMAQLIQARLDRKAGKEDSTNAIMASYAARGGADRPILLSSQPIERIDMANQQKMTSVNDRTPPSSLMRLTASNTVAKWADVGFWITADGHVTDVEVLRGEGSQSWLKPVLNHVKTRLYAPLRASADGSASPGFYMIERYTLTARWSDASDGTATHMRRREPVPRIERIDITPENYQRPIVDKDEIKPGTIPSGT